MSNEVEYGCIMAMLNRSSSSKILEINKKLIPDDFLYTEEDEEFGRENKPHVTIKYGFIKTYNKNLIGKLFSTTDPFKIILTKIDIFSNPKFDVVKFNVESDTLKKFNSLLSKLPNVDEYPVYNPHLTLAYVLPGEGKRFIRELKQPIQLTVDRIKYNNPEYDQYYNLSND